MLCLRLQRLEIAMDDDEKFVLEVVRNQPGVGFGYRTTGDQNHALFQAAHRLVKQGVLRIVRERGQEMVTRNIDGQVQPETERVLSLGFVLVEPATVCG